MEASGEQAWPGHVLTVAGPAAVGLVAAARAAVTVASTVLRRVGVTAGRVGDGREAGRGQLAARSLWMTLATPWMVLMP
ncbi:hypothetical protein GCM10010276_49700 [Streptomyces longisporus]|uniref:Uncharacterized protein n=1 Tax=Streptomyces longisporus TaxID=1948 RepID=A0ABP5ZS29_STRLO